MLVFLTKAEVAELVKMSVSTIERAIRSGDLRAGGSPGLVRIKPEWVEEWMSRRRNGDQS